MSLRTAVGVVSIVLLLGMAGVAMAYSPSLDVVHEHDAHTTSVADVEYDHQTDLVYSLDDDGTFVAYQIQQESASVVETFDAGHALANGDGVVYVAAGDTLWEYDPAEANLTEVSTMPVHPPAIAYDERRDVVWAAGDGNVTGYNVSDGGTYMRYAAHSDGVETVAVQGDYVASGTTWKNEVVVYDVADDEVAFEPDLPDDVGQVPAVALTEDEELIVGTGANESDVVAMYDVTSGEQLAQYREHIFSVSEVEYDAEHDVIISLGFDNTAKFYDVEAGEVAAVYEHDDTIYAGDIDTRNDLLWVGDGEDQPGNVTGIDIFVEPETPSPTATEMDTSTPAESETPTAGDGPGFGVAVALLALVSAALFAARRQ
jgi:PGF-CTERM protein